MQTLPNDIFNDFDARLEIWDLYGELLDFYADINFTAKQVAYETNHSTKTVNKILHRLIQHKAVRIVKTDHWGIKIYRINEAFTE